MQDKLMAAMQRTRFFHHWRGACLGGVCALGMAELSMRLLTSALDNQWDPIGSERSRAAVREVRRYTEGIAHSHFTSSRERLTGHSPVVGGQDGIILGDSYVEAVQVSDGQTMGAVLEEALRANGRKVNVHQYGWSGMDIPYYVYVAPDLIGFWNPAWVVVVITYNDLGPNLFTGGYRIEKGADGRWAGVARPARPATRARRISETVLAESSLLYQLSKRAHEGGVPLVRRGNRGSHGGPGSMQPGAIPLSLRANIALAALRDAYGDLLRILFIADVGVDGQAPASAAENAVMAACDAILLQCANTRGAMTQDRLASRRLSRGFMNSAPGTGHLNPRGHALAAETIRRDLINP